MRRRLLENENIIRQWGPLSLSTHRLWIESGDEDNFFLNSLELKDIQGHSIIKHCDKSLLNYALACLIISPLSVLLAKWILLEFNMVLTPQNLNILYVSCGLGFLLIGAWFFWGFRSSRRLTLNFQAGSKNLYFKLTGDFTRIDDALDFSNQVDGQIHQLKLKIAAVTTTPAIRKEPHSFKIS